MTKRRVVFILIVFAFTAAPAIAAFTVRLTDAGGSTNGGPFRAELYKDGSPFMDYNTFCIEDDRYISLNKWYAATIDSAIYYGDTQPNPLEVETQKLYSAYLNGYISDVDTLQLAIWQLEASQTNGIDVSTWLGSLDATAVAGYQNVRVLNIWSDQAHLYATGSYDKQSQLIRIPASWSHPAGLYRCWPCRLAAKTQNTVIRRSSLVTRISGLQRCFD